MADSLVIRGAREHNLRNVSVELPRDKLIVFTGLSGRASPPSRSTPSTPRASAATSSRSRPTPASSSARWTSPTSTSSRACRRPSRSTRRAPPATPARPWARSPRSTTTCGCSTPASAWPTAPTTARRSSARPRRRSSTASWSCPRAPASRCWHRSSAGARAPTRRCWPTSPPQGFARARVDGEVRETSDKVELARYEQHTIEVIVDRLVRRDGIERRLTDSLETALRARRRRGRGPAGAPPQRRRDRRGRPGRQRPARDAHVQPAPGLPDLRAVVRRAGAAQLLVQLALRRLRDVRRPGHPLRGRPRAGGSRPVAVSLEDGAIAPVVVGPPALLPAPGGGGGRRAAHRHGDAVRRPERQAPQGGPLRHRASTRCGCGSRTATAASARTTPTTRA